MATVPCEIGEGRTPFAPIEQAFSGEVRLSRPRVSKLRKEEWSSLHSFWQAAFAVSFLDLTVTSVG
jgi:hypothetical protein